MEKQQDISNLVDLFTFNRELESIMLSDYPGKIKESQCSIDETGMDGKKLYRFYDLDKQTLLNFLAGKKYAPRDQKRMSRSRPERRGSKKGR
mgnify:CR=1 FL=1